MISCHTLSYAFSHHLLHQASELSRRLPDYLAVTPSFFTPANVARVGRLSRKLQTVLARRTHPAVPPSTIRTYPVEHLYQACARIAGRPYSYFSAHDRMARRIVRDFNPPHTLIAIDTGAEGLFRAWRGRSRLVLDLTIATPHYRSKIFTEAEASPVHRGVRFHHPGDWELSRYAAEVSMADLILCPSEFVMDSCRHLGAPESKLRLLPYGFDPGRFSPPKIAKTRGAFRVVFAGTFSHRKGSHLLLDAFTRFQRNRPGAELHVFGEVLDAPERVPPGVTLHGRVPQELLAERFRDMHVMAFPTLFEGSAYVVYQALASGLPVITTHNCGSVVNASCGLILDTITADALHDALLRCHDDRSLLDSLSAAAPKVASHYTWARYGERLTHILNEDPSARVA